MSIFKSLSVSCSDAMLRMGALTSHFFARLPLQDFEREHCPLASEACQVAHCRLNNERNMHRAALGRTSELLRFQFRWRKDTHC